MVHHSSAHQNNNLPQHSANKKSTFVGSPKITSPKVTSPKVTSPKSSGAFADKQRPMKMVVVGDGAVGKTCLLISYTAGEFPDCEYIPTVFENYAGKQEVDGHRIALTLWDTAGQEDYERLRPLSYPGADVFLLCYSVDSVHSYQNIATKWQPEVRSNCPKTPYVLVGTKTDLRPTASPSDGRRNKLLLGVCGRGSDEQLAGVQSSRGPSRKEPEAPKVFVPREEGRKLACRIKASKYVECSAKTMDGVEEVFKEAIRAALDPKRVERSRCTLM